MHHGEVAAPRSLPQRWTLAPSVVGELLLTASDAGLTGVFMSPVDDAPIDRDALTQDPADPVLRAAGEQLAAYWAGDLTAFDLPLDLHGTPFQQRVWGLLCAIPYGTTTSYGALAVALGSPGAARAVGLANGRNPVSLVVPCHRVVASSGTLTGYAGGLDRKRWLLAHEATVAARSAPAGTLF